MGLRIQLDHKLTLVLNLGFYNALSKDSTLDYETLQDILFCFIYFLKYFRKYLSIFYFYLFFT